MKPASPNAPRSGDLQRGLLAALALTLPAAAAAAAAPHADLILHGGAIYTLDAARPWASALVVDRGHIVYVGDGWSQQAFGAEGPSRAKLDELVPDRPAFLRNEDGYVAWVNSKAPAIAGIDAKGPAVASVGRDPATGVPTGLLKADAVDLIRNFIPPPTPGGIHRGAAALDRDGQSIRHHLH